MPTANRAALSFMVREYFQKDPLLAVRSLEAMPEDQAVEVLSELSGGLVSDIFVHLQTEIAANLFKKLSQDRLKAIIEKLEPSQGAALLMRLGQEEREKLSQLLSEKTKLSIQELLTYPENSAGRIMNMDFLALPMDLNVKSAIQRIRLLARKKSTAFYAYVIDRENHLVGVINMRDLMLASNESALESIMRRDVFAVSCFMDREEVADELTKRKYFAAPVIDEEKHLVGIVQAEGLLEDVQEEATEDLQKMFGAGGSERAFSSLWFSLQKRIPWLHVNLATAFLAGSVVAIFRDTIGKFPILAVYLPVVAGQGGNAGAQSLVVVIRGLVMREIPPHKVWKLIRKEASIGIMNGLVIGSVTALACWLWHGNPFLGLVVGLAMLTNLIIAGITGAAIPLAMRGLRLDPAQCSNIILTTFTDVMGFLALLGFAMLFESHLT